MSKKSVKPQKSQTTFYVLLAVVAAVGGYALYAVTRPTAPVVMAADPTAPPVEAAGVLYGNPDAPITIIEYADFGCGGCAQFSVLHTPDIKSRIVDAGLANFRFYDFPLGAFPNSMAAHLAAACANDQGKFWEMSAQIFNGQSEWNTPAVTNPRRVLAKLAEEVGVGMPEWNACFDAQKHIGQIEANRNAGQRIGVRSTPTIQIGNTLYGSVTADNIKRIVDSLTAARAATPPAP